MFQTTDFCFVLRGKKRKKIGMAIPAVRNLKLLIDSAAVVATFCGIQLQVFYTLHTEGMQGERIVSYLNSSWINYENKYSDGFQNENIKHVAMFAIFRTNAML